MKPDSANSVPIYTAAQLAVALGMSKRGFLNAVQDCPATGTVVVSGQEARTWSFSDLPQDIRQKLAAIAAERGHRNAIDLLSESFKQWAPPLPLSEIKQRFVDKAAKLRDALAKPLDQQDTPSAGSLTELGLTEFQRVFGYPISAKQWRRLFDRTVQRAGPVPCFQRLELYLDDAAFSKHEANPASVRRASLHRELDEMLNGLDNKADPTPDDRAQIFDAAFAHYERLAGATSDLREQKAIKASLIDYLFSCIPGLSKNRETLRRIFEIKYAHWVNNDRSPTSLDDGRRVRSGNFQKMDFTKDLQKIRDLAIDHDGIESLAYRKLRQAGELSPDFVNHYHFDPRRAKSYVPRFVRQAITPEVEKSLSMRRGPWEAKMRGPYFPRKWGDLQTGDGVQPGEWFSGDDVTWNHYFRFRDDDGQWRPHRGECLLLTDLRTGYPLEFLLIPGHYNSEHIRALILRVHDKIGLPHKGFYFEQGVWKARLIPGQPRVKCQPLHWRETELGLQNEEISLDRRHATTPRAKPIEGLFHILQDRMRCIPGFIGFNERTDAREREQELLLRAKRSGSDEILKLPTMEAWRDQIRVVLDEFANDPQNGKMLPGISPAEAWKAGLERRPLRKLPDAARYLFATHKQVVRVRQEGIILTIRGQRLLYCGEATGSMIGREVIAFYNVECPELLTISDMKRQNYFTVQRIELPAMSATSEQYAAGHSSIKGHMKAAKGIYGNIQHPVIATISRDNQVDEAAQELGRFHNEQVEQHREKKTEAGRKLGRIQIEAATAGIAVNPHVRNLDRALEGLDLIKEARERIANKSALQGFQGSTQEGNCP